MTENKAFKREVRAGMEITGRTYADRRRIVLAEREAEQADREAEADADKAAGLFERYDTDEMFLALFEEPDAEPVMNADPVNLDAIIADMRARAEGWNSERYTMLSPEAAAVLVAELDRLRAVEAKLESARQALDDDEALWRRMLPQLERWADDRNRRMAREHAQQAAEWRGVRAV